MDIRASELERAYKKYDELKEKDIKLKGGIDTVLSQLKKLGINSIEEAETFIKSQNKEKNSLEQKFDALLLKIKKLLKK